MEDKRLSVFIAGKKAGSVVQARDGSLSFAYYARYAGIPLSLSMPLSNRTFGDKVVRPYLMGLLPDSPDVRRSLGREFGVSGENPFALLQHVGLDCPGAVQICSESREEDVLLGSGALTPLSDADIASRLAAAHASNGEKWEAERERWSLGGQQTKFALRLEGDRWYSCEGRAATTHILKPGIPGLRLEALNELVCLRLASACGIPAARADYRLFEDEPAIVVERYDRVRDSAGEVVRLHQEDLCQALSVLPQNKYAQDGGPSANDVVDLLKKTGAPARDNLHAFMRMLLFNYVIAAPDAHAKNYSLLIDRDAVYLAPLYDVASMLPYTSRPEKIKLAMSVAGENRVAMLSARRLAAFAEANGLEEYGLGGDALASILAGLAELIPCKLEDVVDSLSGAPNIDELGDRLIPSVGILCARSIKCL